MIGVVMGILPAARAGEWPQFRGPNGDGVSSETRLPESWGPDKNVRWTFKDPGFGWSSPVVWGDKVFVTTSVSEKQTKPKPGDMGLGPMGGPGGRGGFGGPGPGGRGRGGFGGPPRPGQILPGFVQGMLNLTEDQKTELDGLQKDVDARLDKILTDQQNRQLKANPPGFGRGGRGGFGPGGFGGPPRPGQVLPASAQERLKLTEDQKKQVRDLQKGVDAKLAKVLTAEQGKQLKDMQQGFARGGRGGRGGFGPGGFGGMGGMMGGPPPNVVYRREVYCLDAATGKVLWKRVAAEKKPTIPKQPTNSYASETPVTDGERVYAYFGMTGLYCYDLAGKPLWHKDLGAYPMSLGFGTGGSPALDGNRLFVQCDNEQHSFLVALDKKTGEQLWRVERAEKSAWSTPFVWHNKRRTELVVCGTGGVRAYDPANGKELWRLGGMTGQPQASPVADDERLYVGRGGPFGGRPLYAIRAGAKGDLTLKPGEKSNAGVAWYLPLSGPAIASPLLYGGYLYIVEQMGGLVSCYDAATGKQVYRERLRGARGFMSSPWAAGGRVFCLDEEGQTFVLQAGPQFKLLGTSKVGEMCRASAAVADGALFLRTVDHVFCIRD
jgi:outer membrane protein assembly factor BamB